MKKSLLIGALFSVGIIQAQTALNPNTTIQKSTSTNSNAQKTYTSCGYLQENNAFENGRVSSTNYPLITADDFIIPANECWGIENVVANFFITGPSDDVRIFFYADNAGSPGTIVGTDTISFATITTTLLGNNFGIDVHEYDCNLNNTITLCGGASGTTYWFSIQVLSASTHYWEFTTTMPYGNNGMSAPSEAGAWTNEGDNYVFEINKSIIVDTVIAECAPFSITIGSNTYDATGTYTEVLTSVAGCDSIVNLDLTVNPMPTNTITQAGALLTADEASATYQWINCDSSNAIVPGATSQNFIPPFTGNYAVVLTNGSGCVDTSACVLVDYTGIDELTNNGSKELIKVVDLMGRETSVRPNTPLIFIYSDGTFERRMYIKD